MKQITVRGFDEDLETYLHQVAKEENISLNKAAIKLLRQAAGLNRKKQSPMVIGHSLDKFIGIWSKDDERKFNDAIQTIEKFDESLWQ